MLYRIAHILRDKIGWLWVFIEWVNSWLFYIRYCRRLSNFSFSSKPDGYEVAPISEVSTDELISFFRRQPKEAFTYFHPHGFDAKSLMLLKKDKAFLGYVLIDASNGKIAGYCFNRSYFHGQGFRGRMVDIGYRGKGLGTAMNKMLNEVGFGIGLRLFETVSKDNVASYRSALAASKVNVVKEMKNNELFLEILPG